MLDPSFQPSQEAAEILQTAGWSPSRQVDAAGWIERLGADGVTVFPAAATVMRSFGDIHLDHKGYGGPSNDHLELDPSAWYGEGDRVEDVAQLVGSRVCPIGMAAGASMLAICEDGRVILEFEGNVIRIGENWRAALDHLILGSGESVVLAEDYVRIPGS
jgi:hypothetical protein